MLTVSSGRVLPDLLVSVSNTRALGSIITHRQLKSFKPSWWLNSAPTLEGLMKPSLRHYCLGPYSAVPRRVECKLPSPATEADFQGKPVLDVGRFGPFLPMPAG